MCKTISHFQFPLSCSIHFPSHFYYFSFFSSFFFSFFLHFSSLSPSIFSIPFDLPISFCFIFLFSWVHSFSRFLPFFFALYVHKHTCQTFYATELHFKSGPVRWSAFIIGAVYTGLVTSLMLGDLMPFVFQRCVKYWQCIACTWV